MRIVREYINYWLKGRNRHGVHSPFVYYFNDHCLRIVVPKKVKENYDNYISALKKIGIEKPSSYAKTNTNRPNDSSFLRSRSRISFKYLKLMYRITCCYNPKRAVCFGDNSGLFASMLKQANKQTEIDHIARDSSNQPNLATVFPQEWQESVRFHQKKSEVFFATLKQDGLFDLVFIDGRQNMQTIDLIIDSVKPHTHDETIFLIYGIREDPSIRKKWEEWSSREAFNVTIDLFQMGVIVPRKHQAKEHFTIRF
jgi:predicted O-methyltransferase YrrM